MLRRRFIFTFTFKLSGTGKGLPVTCPLARISFRGDIPFRPRDIVLGIPSTTGDFGTFHSTFTGDTRFLFVALLLFAGTEVKLLVSGNFSLNGFNGKKLI